MHFASLTGHMKFFHSVTASLFLVPALACGGGTPTPEPVNPSEVEADAPATLDEPTDAEEEPAVEEEPTSDEPSGPSGGRSPKDMVGAESTRFVLSFNSSDVGIKASDRCDAKHSSDPRKRNQCMKSARSKVVEDVMQFEENKSGQWVWTTSNQRGSTLRHLKQLNFTWGKETKNSIEIQPSKGSTIESGVPNNYSIVIPHAQHGKLVYDAKVSGEVIQ